MYWTIVFFYNVFCLFVIKQKKKKTYKFITEIHVKYSFVHLFINIVVVISNENIHILHFFNYLFIIYFYRWFSFYNNQADVILYEFYVLYCCTNYTYKLTILLNN